MRLPPLVKVAVPIIFASEIVAEPEIILAFTITFEAGLAEILIGKLTSK